MTYRNITIVGQDGEKVTLEAPAVIELNVISRGLPGADGVVGADGADGAPGPKGDKGDTALTVDVGTVSVGTAAVVNSGTQTDLVLDFTVPQGIQGEQGEQGLTGLQGPQGEVGPQGVNGDTGSQGIQGPAGVKGDTGSQGPQGEIGLTGPQGIQGPQGDDAIINGVNTLTIDGGNHISLVQVGNAATIDVEEDSVSLGYLAGVSIGDFDEGAILEADASGIWVPSTSLVEHKADSNLHEAMGLIEAALPTLSFTDATLTLNITGPYDYYINGVKHTTTNQTKAISNTVGLWFIYYDENGDLIASQTSWDIQTTVQIATVYWNGSTGLLADERHGLHMDRKTHEYLHQTVGTRYAHGLAGTFTNTTFSIDAGEWYDEDIQHSTSAAVTTIPVMYKGSAVWLWTAAQAAYYLTTGGSLAYNNAGTLTTVGSTEFTAYWIYATNLASRPFVSIAHTAKYNTIGAARLATPADVEALVSAEFKLLYRVIVKGGTTPLYQETSDYRTQTVLAGTNYTPTSHSSLSDLSTSGHPASVISFTPAGGVSATNVQAAIEEIDGTIITDHTALSNIGTNTHAQIDSHIGDASDPHGATLTQTTINAKKATVETTTIANTGTAATANFAAKGAYAFTANGNATITVSNLTAGQRGTISIYCDGTGRTISWSGVTKWLGTAVGTIVANKLVVVTLFHDGVGIIASAAAEA